MKTTFKYFTAIILFAMISLSAQAQQTNFKGNWKRNTEQTKVSEGVSINSVPVKLEVKQDKNSIAIHRFSVTGAGDAFDYTEALKFDGSVTTTTVQSGVYKKSTVKWSDDKHSFTLTADYRDNSDKQIQQTTETWTLSGDSKMLTIDRSDVIDGETSTLTEIFDKA